MKTHHKCKDGKKIAIKDMTTSHLQATIKILQKIAKEGIRLRDGGGSDGDYWYEETYLSEEQSLKYLGVKYYQDELNSRITIQKQQTK